MTAGVLSPSGLASGELLRSLHSEDTEKSLHFPPPGPLLEVLLLLLLGEVVVAELEVEINIVVEFRLYVFKGGCRALAGENVHVSDRKTNQRRGKCSRTQV